VVVALTQNPAIAINSAGLFQILRQQVVLLLNLLFLLSQLL